MKITVTVEITDAARHLLKRHWHMQRLPNKTDLARWVRQLPETVLVDYLTQDGHYGDGDDA
jgi:hypothetical protein